MAVGIAAVSVPFTKKPCCLSAVGIDKVAEAVVAVQEMLLTFKTVAEGCANNVVVLIPLKLMEQLPELVTFTE